MSVLGTRDFHSKPDASDRHAVLLGFATTRVWRGLYGDVPEFFEYIFDKPRTFGFEVCEL